MTAPYVNPYLYNTGQWQQPLYGGPVQPQYQQQAQFQQAAAPQAAALCGEIVDGIDVVKAKNADLSGKATFYPKADMTEVYTKRLMPDGTSRINTYRLVESGGEDKVSTTLETLEGRIERLGKELSAEIATLKDLMSARADSPAKPQRGRTND